VDKPGGASAERAAPPSGATLIASHRRALLEFYVEDNAPPASRACSVAHHAVFDEFAESYMPWEFFARMTDDDLRAIYRYLRSLPPVHNETGPSIRPKT
jgi:hypothetical protein